MSGDLVLHALGAHIGLDLSALPAEQADEVRAVWTGALVADDLETSATVAVAPAPTPQLLAQLSSRVTLAAIDARRGRQWMIHAAGVADESGRVAALVGASGAGKTTATRELCRQFAYVTDETVAVAADGAVLPYRKPLSIITGDGGPKRQVPPGELGMAAPVTDLTLAAVIVLNRSADGPAVPEVVPLDAGEALTHLVQQSSYLTEMASPLQTLATHLASVGGALRVDYREAADLAAVVRRVLAASPGTAPAVPDTVALPPERVAAGRTAAAGDAADALSRAPFVDALPLAQERLALLRAADDGTGAFEVLAGIAPAIWRAADGSPLRALTEAVVAVHGAPPHGDASAAVAESAQVLLDRGVLRAGVDQWRIRDDIAWTGGADRIAAVPLGSESTPRVVDGTGAEIWAMLEASGRLDEGTLVYELAERFGVPVAAIREQVSGFLHDLEAAALIAR